MMKNDKRRELSVIKNPGAMPTSFNAPVETRYGASLQELWP
jgi:hypothetical protein